jgi:CRP/FNR family transcriptional regulator
MIENMRAATGPLPLPIPLGSANALRSLIGGSPRPTHGFDVCDAWFGADALARWSATSAPPVPCRLQRHQTLAHEGNAAHHLYLVQAGDFKVTRTAEDGYEQVLDFPGRGEILCLDALSTQRHGNSVVALEDALVLAIPLADLRSLRRDNAVFDDKLQAAMSEQWIRIGEIAWLMAAVGADRRTARFLTHMSRRMADRGYSAHRLRLRMNRRDIAAHLGLAHESISRAMTSLAAAGLLEVRCRDLEILDLPGLEAFALCTRGHSELPAADASKPASVVRRSRHATVALAVAN